MNSRAKLLALLILAATTASAQDVFLAHWQSLQPGQPDGAKFTISVAKERFYLGETIAVQLSFTSSIPRRFRADTGRTDRFSMFAHLEDFILDPAASTEDPLEGLFEASGGSEISGGPVILPFNVEKILNEWVRFKKPGTYRFYLVSKRVGRLAEPERSDFYQRIYARPTAVTLVSNVITLQVLPAPAAWVKQQIAEADGILETPASLTDQAAQVQRQRAGRTLRYLSTPAADLELLRHLDDGQGPESRGMYYSLLGSHDRAKLLPIMEQRLTAAEQPVWRQYLDTLAVLWDVVTSGGPIASFPQDEARKAAWMAESKRRAEARVRKSDEYISRLLASLGSKVPAARYVCLATLLDLSDQSSSSPQPQWRPTVIASLIAEFPNLPPATQRNLLEYRWAAIRSPQMLPALRQVFANPPAQYDPGMDDTALRRLYEMAPDEARALILDQIRYRWKNIRTSTLAMLPDRTLPELDKFFIERLQAGPVDESVIVRYGTANILAAAEKAYQNRHLTQCATPLVYYFLKHDPKFGEAELRRSLSVTGAAPVCYDMAFQLQQLGIGRYAMSPALEWLAIEYLNHPAVTVERGAAEVLGKYGSSAAQGPLWMAMEKFRASWKGREEQLKEGDGLAHAQLERALRIALAEGDGWVLDEPDLRRLHALCSSDWCRQEVTSWLSTAKAPAEISVQQMSEGFIFNVAQYNMLSGEQLRHKLAEFPIGTIFRVAVSGMEGITPGMKQARESAELAVRESGHKMAQ